MKSSEKVFKEFKELVKKSGTSFSQCVQAILVTMEGLNEAKNRVSKESRSFPNLIFTMEKYEVLLIKLSKQSGVSVSFRFKEF